MANKVILDNIEVFFMHPITCPICGGNVVYEQLNESINLVCDNPNCEGKLINRLDHFCGKKGLDIKGLSVATLEKLVDWEWVNTCEDIFNLDKYKSEWMNKPGFGEKSVSNILNAIQEGKNCKLDKFIAALGIPLIGSRAGKDLANYFGSWTEFIKAIDTKFKFYDLPNFGAEMHSAITEFDYTEAKILAEKYLNITVDEAETTSSTLEGKTFVVTGKLTKYKNRNEIKALIETLGGKVSDSINGKTNYLINNDVNSTSSKNLSAKKLNIPIISEEDFIALLG
jgi:DNA ligase (NAD+)